MMLAKNLMAAAGNAAQVVGTFEAIFTSGTTNSFVVPAGVTSISAVCIGGGGGGAASTSGGSGGAGGDLRYYNNLAVTPGETLTVRVGGGGADGGTSAADGGFSRISRGATVLLEAGGGGGGSTSGSSAGSGTSSTIGGSIGGGNGGVVPNGGTLEGGGGGGAGGYAGNGGRGGMGSGGDNGAINSGAAGGGGGCGDGDGGGNGAGVNVFGLGPTGQGGATSAVGGYAATGGSYGDGGLDRDNVIVNSENLTAPFGSGGGGADNAVQGRAGGGGAVRIIWPGTSRSFPSTSVWMSDIITAGLETQSETATTIIIPAAAQAGDLAVLMHMSETTGTQSDPSGWIRIVNQQTISPVMTCWYRILQSGDAGTTVTMTTGVQPSSEMIVLRKASGAVSSVTVSGATIANSAGIVATQTQTVLGTTPATIVFAAGAATSVAVSSSLVYFTGGTAGVGNREPAVVFTGANGDTTRQAFLRFRIYDVPPSNNISVVNGIDLGAQTMASFTIGVN